MAGAQAAQAATTIAVEFLKTEEGQKATAEVVRGVGRTAESAGKVVIETAADVGKLATTSAGKVAAAMEKDSVKTAEAITTSFWQGLASGATKVAGKVGELFVNITKWPGQILTGITSGASGAMATIMNTNDERVKRESQSRLVEYRTKTIDIIVNPKSTVDEKAAAKVALAEIDTMIAEAKKQIGGAGETFYIVRQSLVIVLILLIIVLLYMNTAETINPKLFTGLVMFAFSYVFISECLIR